MVGSAEVDKAISWDFGVILAGILSALHQHYMSIAPALHQHYICTCISIYVYLVWDFGSGLLARVFGLGFGLGISLGFWSGILGLIFWSGFLVWYLHQHIRICTACISMFIRLSLVTSQTSRGRLSDNFLTEI